MGKYVPYQDTTADVPTPVPPGLPRPMRNAGLGTIYDIDDNGDTPGSLLSALWDADWFCGRSGGVTRESHRLVLCPDEEIMCGGTGGRSWTVV